MIRLAIVGCKNMGKKHFNVIKTSFADEVEVVGILNSRPESTTATAKELGVRAFVSLDEITKENVDAVIVATPAENHLETASALIKKQIPLLIEKPLAANPQECKKLKLLAEKYNTLILAGHTENYNPAVEKMLSMIKKPLKAIKGIRTSCNPGEKKTHIISELMIHDLAILNRIFKEWPKKYMVSKKDCYRWDENATVFLEYEEGTKVEIEATRSDVPIERNMQIIDADNDVYNIVFHERLLTKNGEPIVCVGDSLKKEIRDFVNMITKQTEPLTSVDEACRNVEFCRMLEEKSRKQQTYDLGKVTSAARRYNGLG